MLFYVIMPVKERFFLYFFFLLPKQFILLYFPFVIPLKQVNAAQILSKVQIQDEAHDRDEKKDEQPCPCGGGVPFFTEDDI